MVYGVCTVPQPRRHDPERVEQAVAHAQEADLQCLADRVGITLARFNQRAPSRAEHEERPQLEAADVARQLAHAQESERRVLTGLTSAHIPDSKDDDQIGPVTWRYGSRTKSAPFVRSGLWGSQAFCVPVAAPLLGLLSVGSWLGAGEGASFGCGHFRWRLRPANDLPVWPLWAQPWSGGHGDLLD